MSENKFQHRYRIPSARAHWHNYNGGTYFVTICTQGREHYFGEITPDHDGADLIPNRNGVLQRPKDLVETFPETSLRGGNIIPKMTLSPIGKYTDEQFRNVRDHYPYAEIPLWVVMPNHVHAVVVIDHNKIPYEKRNLEQHGSGMTQRPKDPVETFPETSQNKTSQNESSQNKTSQNKTFEGDVETFQETSLQRGKPIQIATDMQSWLSVVIRQIKQSVTRFAKQSRIPFAWQSRYHDHIIRDTDEMNKIANYIEHNVANWEQDCFLKR